MRRFTYFLLFWSAIATAAEPVFCPAHTKPVEHDQVVGQQAASIEEFCVSVDDSSHKEGPYRSWFDAGKKQIHLKGQYKDNRREGHWETWRRDGSIATDEYFRSGRRNGPVSEWDTNGHLLSMTHFKNGVASGTRSVWANSGELKERWTFVDGKWVRVYPNSGSTDHPRKPASEHF